MKKVSMGKARCIGETPKALLIFLEGTKKEIWRFEQDGELIVAEWWGLENAK